MTKTDKLKAAWSVLQSKNEIEEMFVENRAQNDEIEATSKRLGNCATLHSEKVKTEQIEKYAQKLAIAGITTEDLEQHLNKKPKRKGGKRERIVIAVIDGVEITQFGAIPKIIKEKGISHRNDIPSEYWTNEGKEYFKN